MKDLPGIKKQLEHFAFVQHQILPEHDKQHVLNIAESVYRTKSGIGPIGGSFVEAIVNNDLYSSFAKADMINQNYIKFYVIVAHHFTYKK